MSNPISVYGTDWCEDTIHTRQHLNELGLDYEYIDIEQDVESAEWVKEVNKGKQITPTLDVAGKILVEPDNDELDDVLRSQGLFH